MPHIIGIDPGLTGAICVLDTSNYALIEHMHMPTMKSGTKNTVNGIAVTDFIAAQSDVIGVCIENVSAGPNDGKAGAFSFGKAAGICIGVVQAFNLPMHSVAPQSWKKKAGLLKTEKDAARSLALQYYPSVKDLALKGKGQALADSIFIARFGVNKFIVEK